MTGHRVGNPLLALVLSLLFGGGPVFQSEHPEQAGTTVISSQFFPPGTFEGNENILARAYSRYLRLMGEKPLGESPISEGAEVYRVLVELRPYNSPVVVRLRIRNDGSGELTAKVGRDGGHPQILTVDRTADVSPTNVGRFLQLLNEARFWSMPTEEPDRYRRSIIGGEGWMIEANKNGSYHAVCRAVSGLGALKDPAVFAVANLGRLDLRSLPVGPEADKAPTER
jgi:hypothetical protein